MVIEPQEAMPQDSRTGMQMDVVPCGRAEEVLVPFPKLLEDLLGLRPTRGLEGPTDVLAKVPTIHSR